MAGTQTTHETSRKPKGSSGTAEEVEVTAPEVEQPGQEPVLPEATPKVPDTGYDIGQEKKFSWKVDGAKTKTLEKQAVTHVLQAHGGLIANCHGKEALTFPKKTVFGDRLERLLKSDRRKRDFLLMVGLTLDLAEFTKRTCTSFNDGFNLTMAQFAEAGVLSLHSLETMTEAEVKATLPHVPGRIMGAAQRLGSFMRLNADHKVLDVLGIDIEDLTSNVINNVLESDRQAKAIPEAFAEKFRKTVPNPCDSTIIHFMDSFSNVLLDFGLHHMMTVSDEDLEFGKHHLVDRIISKLLVEKVRKTSAFHCIQGNNMLGMGLYREVVKTFFDESKKTKLHEKVLDNLKEIRLLRVSDVHDFFTSAQWFYHYLTLLDPCFGRDKFDKILGDCLDKSHTWLQNQKDGDVTFVGLLSRKGELGAEKLQEELFKLYTTMKLSGDGLPENFFPSYVSIKAYLKTQEELTSCGKKKRDHVPTAASRQKEEARVRFVGTQKRKANDSADSEAKADGGQGKAGAEKERAFWRNRPKKAKQN